MHNAVTQQLATESDRRLSPIEACGSVEEAIDLNTNTDQLRDTRQLSANSTGLVIAKLVALTNGVATIVYQIDDCRFIRDAQAIVGQQLVPSDVGEEVCLAFADNDLEKPIILGKFRHRTTPGTPLSFESDTHIILRCGKASISLKADGTVAIRGTNVASRASHTNRIRGGNVQIN